MKNKKIASVFFTFLVFGFSAYSWALADTATTSSSTIVSQATSTPVNTSGAATSTAIGLQAPLIPPLIAEITQAKQDLAAITLNHALSAVYKTTKNKKTGKTAKIISKYNLTSKDIALAIWNPTTNSIITTVGMQTGQSMKFSDPAVDIKLTSFNGVNSKFQINTPANGTVLALKYLITGPESGSKASIENALSPSLYVPYSAGLNDPSVETFGEQYLDSIIHNVATSLQNFPSQAIPGETVTQAIPPAMIKALVYAEHTDTNQVLNGNVQDTINQLNILFATNQADAYKYSVSTANARGIAQFIPSTYASLVNRHPDANLIADFNTAMADHTNSIKAMYLLLDDYAGAVRVKAAQNFASARVFEYGAASYNGGTTRVANAVKQYGSNWNEDRSGQINDIQGQINGLTSQVKSLKSKIKKTADKKTKSSLQGSLASDQSLLASATDQLSTLQSSTLKNETINYLNKIYKVITVFNDQTI